MNRRALIVATCLLGATGLYAQGLARDSAEIERDLPIELPGTGTPRRLDLAAAICALNIPSVSVALIGTLDWARVFGRGATADTLYQAASLSKLVTAVAALRLVEQGRLALDRDVNEQLTGWRLPDSPLTRGHPVTLRGLLNMTAGIGVPGYVGYAPEQPLPDLVQILDGAPPANSPPVRVESVPGARYAYSGGGYEIVQALIETVTGRSFEAAMQKLVLQPLGMSHSMFVQPLPPALVGRAAEGHDASGAPLPGGWRVVPELAAGGLWSTPTDLAKLLIAIARAFRGERPAFLGQATARAMLTRQSVGPYGLGGAVDGAGSDLVLMKRGQNVGYQSYMLIFPVTGQGMVVMTGSDSGTTLATALIRRAASAYRWPGLGELRD
ncbi:MAG: serine hydrolase domain-containing protein [Rhodoplanes sp.]